MRKRESSDGGAASRAGYSKFPHVHVEAAEFPKLSEYRFRARGASDQTWPVAMLLKQEVAVVYSKL